MHRVHCRCDPVAGWCSVQCPVTPLNSRPQQTLCLSVSLQVRPVVADFLGYFRASGTQGGITSGSQWLVRRQEAVSPGGRRFKLPTGRGIS